MCSMDFDRSMVAEAVVVAVLPILAKSVVAVSAAENGIGMSILFCKFYSLRFFFFTCSGIGGGGGKSLSAFICWAICIFKLFKLLI